MLYVPSRTIIKASSTDAQADSPEPLRYLQKLITADITKIQHSIHSFLLDAKGRFAFDFFIHTQIHNSDTTPDSPSLYIETSSEWAEPLMDELLRYKIREKVKFEILPSVQVQISSIDTFLQEWLNGQNSIQSRILTQQNTTPENTESNEYLLISKILNKIPTPSIDLKQEKSIILDFGFDELHSVNFTKGCYLGQELMTRTKRTGQIRKRLFAITPSSIANSIKQLASSITIQTKHPEPTPFQPKQYLKIHNLTQLKEISKEGILSIAPFSNIFQNENKIGVILASHSHSIFLAQLKFAETNLSDPLVIRDKKNAEHHFSTIA